MDNSKTRAADIAKLINSGAPDNEIAKAVEAIQKEMHDADEGPLSYLDYIKQDPEIFTESARGIYDQLPTFTEKSRYLSNILADFYKRNPEYSDFIKKAEEAPALLLDYFKAIKKADFEAAKVLTSTSKYNDRYKELQDRIKTAGQRANLTSHKLKDIWPVLRIRDIFTESELAAFYYLQHPRNEIKKPEVLAAPLDPLNNKLYNVLISGGKHKAKLDIPTTPHKNNAPTTQINALLYFDDDITKKYSLTKSLTSFDKLVASAVYSIWRVNHDEAGRCITTLTAIHNCISKTTPTPAQLEKIRNSLLKQSLTRLEANNRQEAPLDYEEININAALIHIDFIEAKRNGKTTDAAIIIYNKLPAFDFAERHNHQLTDIPVELFKSGISLTDKNLAIQDYLIRRISRPRNAVIRMKDDQAKHYTQARQKQLNAEKAVTIKVNTLLENIGRDKGPAIDKQRAISTTMRYLEHYKTIKWIKAARLSKDHKSIKVELY